jgi:hypothetical protein
MTQPTSLRSGLQPKVILNNNAFCLLTPVVWKQFLAWHSHDGRCFWFDLGIRDLVTTSLLSFHAKAKPFTVKVLLPTAKYYQRKHAGYDLVTIWLWVNFLLMVRLQP